jgi:hypothetical protein
MMLPSGASRQFAATQTSVAFGAKRTLTEPRSERPKIASEGSNEYGIFRTIGVGLAAPNLADTGGG